MKIFVLLIGNFFKHKIFCRTGKNISFFLTLWFLLLYFRYTLQFRFYSAVARISLDTHIFVFDDLKKWLIKKTKKMYKPFYMPLRKPGFGQFNFILENEDFKFLWFQWKYGNLWNLFYKKYLSWFQTTIFNSRFFWSGCRAFSGSRKLCVFSNLRRLD